MLIFSFFNQLECSSFSNGLQSIEQCIEQGWYWQLADGSYQSVTKEQLQTIPLWANEESSHVRGKCLRYMKFNSMRWNDSPSCDNKHGVVREIPKPANEGSYHTMHLNT